jgi:serine protease Do
MDRPRTRRAFLSTCGALAAAGVAGCNVAPATGDAAPDGDGAAAATPTPAGDPGADAEAQSPDSTEPDRFVDVYESTVGSVAQIQVIRDGGRGQGAGWVYDGEHVVTNEHVVDDSGDVYVRFPESGWLSAAVVGTDVYSDLAVLAVDGIPDGATPLDLGESDPPVGAEVVAIGNPFGFSGSVTAGIVSGVNRTLPAPNDFSIPDAIQTDAPVNPGNSGGPLVDLAGTVVGVVNSGGGDNVGFAISAALTRRVIPALLTTGDYRHSYMGIRLRPVGPLLAQANDVPGGAGVYVTEVVDGSPSAGVLQGSTGETTVDGVEGVPTGGDVIVGMAGTDIDERQALSTVLALETSPGDTVPVTVLRDGEQVTLDLTLGTRPDP